VKLQDSGRKSRRGVAVCESNPFIAAFASTEAEPRAGFVRLYPRGVEALRGLSGAGAKVFELLCLGVQKPVNGNKVRLRFGAIDQAACPMSKTTYFRGFGELVERGFLAATTEQGWFWFNAGFVAKPTNKKAGEEK
jgi:hypothetical protein